MLRDFCSPRIDGYRTMINTSELSLYNEGPSVTERRARLIGFDLIQSLDVFNIARFTTRGIAYLRNNILTGLVQLNVVNPRLRRGMRNNAPALTRNRMNAKLDALRQLAMGGGPVADVVGVLLPLIDDMRSKRRDAIGMFFS